MQNKIIKEKIREICTYHGGDGTSGYLLDEQRFAKIFELIDETCEKEREYLMKYGYVIKGSTYNGNSEVMIRAKSSEEAIEKLQEKYSNNSMKLTYVSVFTIHDVKALA